MGERKRVPGYLKHKAKGLAIVVLDGRMHYLGKHGSEAEYRRLVAEWLTAQNSPASVRDRTASTLTVGELIAAYIEHAETYYRNADGDQTGEVGNVRLALRPVGELYAHTLAREFGPKALEALRTTLIERDLSRKVINQRINVVRRAFRWAESKKLVVAGTYHGLASLQNLKAHRSPARETAPVRPVAWPHVEAVVPHLSKPLQAVVLLQWWTGARPDEILSMRTGDIDREGKVWLYRPRRHKTQHLGKDRVIALGPKAQEIVQPLLHLDPDAHLFTPNDAEVARRTEQHSSRRSKVTPSQRLRAERAREKPRQTFNDRYETRAYARAVARACTEADVPRWSPNTLRHAAATRLRRELGIEAARVVLGHSSSAVTEIYAELDRVRAIEAMRDLG